MHDNNPYNFSKSGICNVTKLNPYLGWHNSTEMIGNCNGFICNSLETPQSSANSGRLLVTLNQNEIVNINSAQLISNKIDKEASNGIIHFVDEVC